MSAKPGTTSELAFISLGSNIEPERYLPLAAEQLRSLGQILAVSTVYQNPAVGPTRQPDYLNAVILVETSLSPVQIRNRLRAIEAALGRVRTSDKYAPRTIDLDLLLLGERVRDDGEPVLPDPDLLLRPHLAVPAAELKPDFPHPVTGETLRALADRLRASAPLTPRPDVRLLPVDPQGE